VDAIGECLTLDELEDERRDDRLIRPERRMLVPIDGADARMIERGQRSRLALESREARRVGGERRRQHFDRDVATEPGVACAIDLAHAADANG
jgi:hypothetical protein